MLWEATVALMSLMFVMWAAAIWATYTYHDNRSSDSIAGSVRDRNAA